MERVLFIAVMLILCLNKLIDGKGFDPFGNPKDDKLRLCFVEARGTYKKAGNFCPMVEQHTKIECVVGIDPPDCLRRIHKEAAHFGVFSAEDLLTAEWANVDVLITNEMRFNDAQPFEYELVAVVSNDAGINSVNDLRGSKFCHPGHGLESQWSEILGNYFESTLVARGCEDELSVTESRIKASANFFGPSCKPGPWVADAHEDALLKRKYPSLCEICHNPSSCSKSDKHWGRVGPLYCLTSGHGEVAWLRLDDVRSHFGFSGLAAESDPQLYSFLCPDGHLQPLHTSSPCVWVAKPWTAVAARRENAAHIQLLVESLSRNDIGSWQNALLNLMEPYHANVSTLDTTIPIRDYLEQAIGFTSAYSFPSCNPPRDIVFCSASIIDHYKCSWLQESARVRGIEPNVQCVRASSPEECMDSVAHFVADIVLVDQRDRVHAQREYQLQPILYEFAKNISHRYAVTAVVRADSGINSVADLRNKRACFPHFEDATFLSALEMIRVSHHGEHDPQRHFTTNQLLAFFSESSCTWHSSDSGHCSDIYRGDEGALRCLLDNRGDVAFVDMLVYQKFQRKMLSDEWTHGVDPNLLKVICLPNDGAKSKTNAPCFLHWTSRGFLMINNRTQTKRRNEIYDTFRMMDHLFSKRYESHIIPFSMYSEFDRQQNVLFHDPTESLRDVEELSREKMTRSLEAVFVNYTQNAYFDALRSDAGDKRLGSLSICHIIQIICCAILLPIMNFAL